MSPATRTNTEQQVREWIRIILSSAPKKDKEQAYRGIYELYALRIHRNVLFRVRDGYKADTIVQKAMQRAFNKLDQFRGDGAFFSWLTSIVINQMSEEMGHAQPPEVPFPAMAEPDGDDDRDGESPPNGPRSSSLETAAEMRDLIARLEHCLRRLCSERDQAVMKDYALQFTSEEIAQKHGLPEGTVRRIAHNCRKVLHPCVYGSSANGGIK